jgi:hypothetical protein
MQTCLFGSPQGAACRLTEHILTRSNDFWVMKIESLFYFRHLEIGSDLIFSSCKEACGPDLGLKRGQSAGSTIIV